MERNDTIIALATPPGIGALAVIRISGPQTIALLKKKIVEQERFIKADARKLGIYRFLDRGDVIDEITAIKYSAPRSFTGEDMVEIICHGGSVVPKGILEVLVDAGARYAGKGEFTRRAYSNGKTNLTKAESINQIVNSTTLKQHKSAISSYLGEYQSLINNWQSKIQDILADIESVIEFGEDDDVVLHDMTQSIRRKGKELKVNVIGELEKRKKIKEVEKGVSIAIVGPANAGKSSLLNLLLGYERAIVDKNAGTTRDFITEKREIGGVPTTLIDTAGLKKSTKGVEKKGLERSRELIISCKIILWVTAADDGIKDEEKTIQKQYNQKILGIINKVDLSIGKKKEQMFKDNDIYYEKISALRTSDRKKVEKFIEKEVQKTYNNIQYDCVISNKRQEKIIEEILKELINIEKTVAGQEEIDAEFYREIIKKLEEFTGKRSTEELLNKIFDEFCIGK